MFAHMESALDAAGFLAPPEKKPAMARNIRNIFNRSALTEQDVEESPMAGAFQNQWIGAAGYRIAGGTDEILRNIVSEQVLGLPQDIRVDKNVPFNELPGAGSKK